MSGITSDLYKYMSTPPGPSIPLQTEAGAHVWYNI
jgi:hypothetical protein